MQNGTGKVPSACLARRRRRGLASREVSTRALDAQIKLYGDTDDLGHHYAVRQHFRRAFSAVDQFHWQRLSS